MLEAVEGNIHQRLCALLEAPGPLPGDGARGGRSVPVSAIRGTALGERESVSL